MSVAEAPRRVFLRGQNGSGGGARLTFREGTEGARVHCEVEGGWPTPTYTWSVECPEAVVDLTGDADILLEKVTRDWHNCSLVCAIAHSSLASPLRAVSRLNVTCKYKVTDKFFCSLYKIVIYFLLFPQTREKHPFVNPLFF